MNALFFYFLVLALVVRVVLDLFTLTRSNYFIDFVYCVLYLPVGVFLVVNGTHDLFGYLSIGIALFLAVKGWLEFKRRE